MKEEKSIQNVKTDKDNVNNEINENLVNHSLEGEDAFNINEDINVVIEEDNLRLLQFFFLFKAKKRDFLTLLELSNLTLLSKDIRSYDKGFLLQTQGKSIEESFKKFKNQTFIKFRT